MGGEAGGGFFDFNNLPESAPAGAGSTFHHSSKQEEADAKGTWLFDGLDPLEYRPWKRSVQADLMQLDDTEQSFKRLLRLLRQLAPSAV